MKKLEQPTGIVKGLLIIGAGFVVGWLAAVVVALLS